MKTKSLFTKESIKKTIIILVLIAFSLASIFVVSKYATDAKNYSSIIKSIDDKKATVAGVTAAAAAAATTLALIPNDATTPIAERILEISEYLFIVVCILVLEKSLLTVTGYISFSFLIPLSCLLLIVSLFKYKEKLRLYAFKLIAFALIIVMIVPISVKMSDLIYDANKASVEQVTTEVDTEAVTKDKGWFGNIINKIKEGVSEAVEKTKEILNKFIDVVAIFIISYCAIPILVVLAMIWILKIIFGIKVSIPKIPKPNLSKNKQEININEKEESLSKV